MLAVSLLSVKLITVEHPSNKEEAAKIRRG